MKISRLRFLQVSALAALATALGLSTKDNLPAWINKEELARQWLRENGFKIADADVPGHEHPLTAIWLGPSNGMGFCGHCGYRDAATEYLEILARNNFEITRVETAVEVLNRLPEIDDRDDISGTLARAHANAKILSVYRFERPWFI